MAAVAAGREGEQERKEGHEEEARLWVLLGLDVEAVRCGQAGDELKEFLDDLRDFKEGADHSKTKEEQRNEDPVLDLASKHASLGSKLEGGMFSHNVDSLQRCLHTINAHVLSDVMVHESVSEFEEELADKENIMRTRLSAAQQRNVCLGSQQQRDYEAGSIFSCWLTLIHPLDQHARRKFRDSHQSWSNYDIL
eukprot:212599-Hanusia_phi.AAC.2